MHPRVYLSRPGGTAAKSLFIIPQDRLDSVNPAYYFRAVLGGTAGNKYLGLGVISVKGPDSLQRIRLGPLGNRAGIDYADIRALVWGIL